MNSERFEEALRQSNCSAAEERRIRREREEFHKNLRIVGRRLLWAGVIVAGAVVLVKSRQAETETDE